MRACVCDIPCLWGLLKSEVLWKIGLPQRTVNGVTYASFREAADALGLLLSDQHYVDSMANTALQSAPNVLYASGA